MLRICYVSIGWLSGIASGSAYFAFSCAFQGPNRFVYASYLAIALPFVSFVVFATTGSILLAARRKPVKALKTFWFVSTMAILDISYIG